MITLIIIGIFLTYGLCLAREARYVAKFLDDAGENFALSVRNKKPKFWTSFGKLLFSKIETMEYKLDSLRWQVNAQALREVKLPDSDWWTKQSSITAAPKGEEVFFGRILEFIRQEFRCSASALVLESDEDTLEIIADVVEGPRFSATIRNLFQTYFTIGDYSFFGIHDSTENSAASSDLSVFGFRYSVSFPFVRKAQGNRRAVLWLGYPAKRPPNDLELRAAKELAGKIELHLQAFGQVITLTERVSEAESLSQEKSDYIAHMSHDIRSPLNNIRSILSLFKLETKNPELIEMLEAASRNCDSLGEIVEDLLDYSRHRAGRLEAASEEISLSGSVSDVFESFKVNAKLRGLSLTFEDRAKELGVIVDKRHLRRIITNIVSNALKYTEVGGVSVVVEQSLESRVLLRVKDSGVGMSADKIRALFNPFVRFSAKSEGVGLGLAVTKILVELNKGKIWVTSSEGRGSEFFVEFGSVNMAPRLTESSKVLSVASPKAEIGLISILLVDDDVDCLESLGRLLSVSGFKVVTGRTVTDAISICNFETPDIIITDNGMPDGGGARLIKFARALPYKPLIGILSGTDTGQRDRLLALGADTVFVKPAPVDELIKWARESVNGRGTVSQVANQ